MIGTDASRWTRQKDPVLPSGTRLDVMVEMLQIFVNEFYDQNPLSHLGFVLVKNGEAELLSPLSSNSRTHKMELQSVSRLASSEGVLQGGEFSLQNGLEVAGRSLGHQPRHGSREIVVCTAALSTCDPGSIITETLPRLQQSKVRVSCIALSAELYICRKLADETGGTMGVCLDRPYFRDWMKGQCVPPPTVVAEELYCEMIRMGFPVRTTSDVPELVHTTKSHTVLARTAYMCPQCRAKNAELPADCAVCGLKLVLAPHLARSFHHLFPVAPFVEAASILPEDKDVREASGVPTSIISSSSNVQPTSALNNNLLVTSVDDATCCFACLRRLDAYEETNESTSRKKKKQQEIQQWLRFQCPECNNYFCMDCDAFLHETLHNCPGCLRL